MGIAQKYAINIAKINGGTALMPGYNQPVAR
jgi:hypothetical protein